MFEHTSRYDVIENAIYETQDGRRITYKRRRFLPSGETLPLLAQVTVGVGDRLDLIAFRLLGDGEHYWQICDANSTMNPFDLTSEIGRTLCVPLPQFQEPT